MDDLTDKSTVRVRTHEPLKSVRLEYSISKTAKRADSIQSTIGLSAMAPESVICWSTFIPPQLQPDGLARSKSGIGRVATANFGNIPAHLQTLPG